MTQGGLATETGIELRHFTQYARPLVEEELVRERTAHVKGSRQRRKVYALTDKGRMDAFRLRERVRGEPVRVREGGGVRETTFGKLLEEAGGRRSLVALAQLSERGPLDLGALAAPEARSVVAMLSEAPTIERFVGRRAELETVTRAEGPRIFVVRGVAGIGKSSFGAKVCELLRGHMNLYWHGVRPWDTRTSLLTGLGVFLSALGRPGLRAVLVRGEAAASADVLKEDLPGTRAFLVFDDAHQASEEVLQFLRFLKDAIAGAPDVRALILTRHAIASYDRRDVAIRGLVREIDLGGLAQEEIVALLASGREAELTNLGRRLGGHPLFLELVRSRGHPSVSRQGLRDVHRFIEEEIYSDLSEPERTTLKIASMYRVPVPREAFFATPAASHDVVLALRDRALLQSAGDETLQVHDTVRDFFASILTPSEREGLGRFASTQLRGLAANARTTGNLSTCIDYLSNALQLTPPGEARGALRESLADVEERIGDLPAALTSYKESVRETDDPEVLARLHRKMASAFVVREQRGPASAELEEGFRALGDLRSVERGWLDLVRFGIAWREERWEEAQEGANDALRAFQAFQDLAGEAQAFLSIGKLQIDSPHGDLALAQRSFEEALARSGSLHDPELTAKVRTGMAYLFAYRLGNVEAAQENLAAIEALSDVMRDPHARRAFLMLKGWFNLELLADCESAESHFSEAKDLGREIHDASTITAARYGLAFCRYFRGQLAEARAEFEQLGAEMDPQGFSTEAVECLWMAAECCLRMGDLPGFARMATAFRDPRLAEGVKARPLHSLALQGLEHLLRGDRAGSRAAFEEALRLVEPETSFPDAALLCFIYFYYALTLRVAGEEALATKHMARVTDLLRGQHLEARLKLLPKAERELSETLGRAVARAGGSR